MGIFSWIIFGALAGWIASNIAGKSRRQGCVTNIVVGIVGAFLGGVIFSTIGGQGVTGFNIWSLFVAVIGAVAFLSILNAINR